jgi:hypothetical protein
MQHKKFYKILIYIVLGGLILSLFAPLLASKGV